MRILDNIGLVQDPFHLGAVILEKLIDDLKSKLPFLSKKKGDDDDLDEEEDEGGTETETEVSSEDDEKTSVARSSAKVGDDTSVDEEVPDNSLVAKLKAKISALQKKKPKDDLEAAIADEADVPVKEKKKPNLIVIIGAVGLIAFIFLSDFGEEQAPPVADPAAMLKKRPKKEKPATTETPAENKPSETTPTDTATTEKPATEPTTTTEPSTTETPVDTAVTTPTETTTPTDTAVTTEPTTTEPTTTTEPSTTETPVDTTVTTPTETTPTDSTVTTEPATTEPTTTEPTTTTPEDTTTATTTTTPTDNGSVDSVTGEDTKGADDNLTEQILKDLENQAQGTEKAKPTVSTEYVAPPNFENVGRGLVYNCTGKHWACIDGPSYKACEANASSTKYLTKKTECYPFNVYETQSGCEKMQNRMVSSSAKTEFCGESN